MSLSGDPGKAPSADAHTAGLPVEFSERASRREIPPPRGFTRSAVFEMLSTIELDGVRPVELGPYLTEDFERFLITLHLVGNASGRALEIGANPYYITVLLKEFTDLDVRLTNCFDPTVSGSGIQVVQYHSAITGGLRSESMEFEHVNVESQPLPFPSESMDTALFCEVIEHLIMDPVAALLELHRVLKPGGQLIVSTPNVARLENVARLTAGANLYDPYSGHGAYGRHNREYTRHELVHLLKFCGFDVPDHFTADVHAHDAARYLDVARLAELLAHRREDLGQYLFCRAVKAGPAVGGRPAELYRSVPHHELVPLYS